MPQRSDVSGPPSSFFAPGQWPGGHALPGAPAAAEYAAAFSVELGRVIRHSEMSMSALASSAGLARSTVYDLLNGSTWADMVTIAKLEEVLGWSLWPRLRKPLPKHRLPFE